MPRNQPFPEGFWERAEAFLKDGASYREVARTMGTDHRTVARNLPGYGWDRREMGGYLHARRKESGYE